MDFLRLIIIKIYEVKEGRVTMTDSFGVHVEMYTCPQIRSYEHAHSRWKVLRAS